MSLRSSVFAFAMASLPVSALAQSENSFSRDPSDIMCDITLLQTEYKPGMIVEQFNGGYIIHGFGAVGEIEPEEWLKSYTQTGQGSLQSNNNRLYHLWEELADSLNTHDGSPFVVCPNLLLLG